ncbi:hypothetical protein AB0399_19100 [Streptomyces sp. NPDC088194]|uniref:hypothetical protein n=1 Tax=Streptomyces sp. NPDC088194 TaxID=3154931 RepID=UPI0034503DCE
MAIPDILAGMATTGRWGPVQVGAGWDEVTAAFGEPWDAGARGEPGKWPRLYAYGDLELTVCRCRRVGSPICVQTWRDVIELPSAVPGRSQAFPAHLTHRDVVDALDRAGCPWEPCAGLTFGSQCALTATPSGATFTFEIPDDGEPVLNVMGLTGARHDCPPRAGAPSG